MISVPEIVTGQILDYAGVTVTLIRGVEMPGMAFWRDSGSTKRSSQVDSWRWNPENNVFLVGMLQNLRT
eukprot:7408826-Pyramimonas_sp.AAC.1